MGPEVTEFQGAVRTGRDRVMTSAGLLVGSASLSRKELSVGLRLLRPLIPVHPGPGPRGRLLRTEPTAAPRRFDSRGSLQEAGRATNREIRACPSNCAKALSH